MGAVAQAAWKSWKRRQGLSTKGSSAGLSDASWSSESRSRSGLKFSDGSSDRSSDRSSDMSSDMSSDGSSDGSNDRSSDGFSDELSSSEDDSGGDGLAGVGAAAGAHGDGAKGKILSMSKNAIRLRNRRKKNKPATAKRLKKSQEPTKICKSQKEVDKHLEKLAAEYGGGMFNRLQLQKRRVANGYMYMCPFSRKHFCKVKYFVKSDLSSKTWEFYDYVYQDGSKIGHTGHDKPELSKTGSVVIPKRGIPKHLLQMITKDDITQARTGGAFVQTCKTRMKNGKGKALTVGPRATGALISDSQLRQLHKTAKQRGEVAKGQPKLTRQHLNSVAGFAISAIAFMRKNRKNLEADEGYVIGKPLIDDANKTYACVVTTEEMVLNLARTFKDGTTPPVITVDATYRLTREGWGYLVIGTCEPGGKFHPISYTVCNKETSIVCTYALYRTRLEAERLARIRDF